MKKKILLTLLVLLVIFSLAGCSVGDPIPGDIFTQSVFPSTASTYALGSADLKYTDLWCETGHFDAESMYIGETLLTEEMLIALLEGGSPESGDGGGDMYMSVYDPNLDGFIAELQLALNYSTHSNSLDHAGAIQDTAIADKTTLIEVLENENISGAIDHSVSDHAPSDAQSNSDILQLEIEAVLTGEITTHTHPEGESSGTGLIIKSGSITTDGASRATVTFNTNFLTVNYSINLTVEGQADTIIAQYSSKSVGGFIVHTADDSGKSEPNATVDWQAIEYTNE